MDGEPSLTRVVTIPQAAKLAGWSTSRMRRFLLAKNRELGGTLLVNVGSGALRPRWTVSLAALRLAAAGWFVDADELHETIGWLAERVEETREGLATQGRRVSLVHEATMALAREVAKGSDRARLSIVRDSRRA